MVSGRPAPGGACVVFLCAEGCPALGGASRFELFAPTCEWRNVWVLRLSGPVSFQFFSVEEWLLRHSRGDCDLRVMDCRWLC